MNKKEKTGLLLFIFGIMGFFSFVTIWSLIEDGDILVILVWAFGVISVMGFNIFLKEDE